MARKIWKGNEAVAAAAIKGGCNFYAGYPITPQNEVMELLSWKLPESGGVFVQAESELGAINMVKGASVAGARALTATSAPGLALMQEGIGSMCTCRVPGVIVDMQRAVDFVNPGQYDYNIATKALGHSGLHALVYAASTVQEMMEVTIMAFQKAEQYRTPVYLLFDGMLGQMMEQAELPECMSELPERDWTVGPNPNYERKPRFIMDSPAMKLKGTAGFDANEKKLLDLDTMFQAWEDTEVQYQEYKMDDAQYVVTAYGSSARIAKDAVDQMRWEGWKVGMFQPVSLFPFPKKQYRTFAKRGIKGVTTVEMTPISQFHDDVCLSVGSDIPVVRYHRCGANIVLPSEIIAAVKGLAAREESN